MEKRVTKKLTSESLEYAGRVLLELAREEGKEMSPEALADTLIYAAGHFENAADKYEENGNLKKAQANYRLAAKTRNKASGKDRRNANEIYRTLSSSAADRLKRRRLEGKIEATTAIIGLIGGLFFLSGNVTGNAIGLNQSTGNILGAVLLCVGLVGSFFWFRSRKK